MVKTIKSREAGEQRTISFLMAETVLYVSEAPWMEEIGKRNTIDIPESSPDFSRTIAFNFSRLGASTCLEKRFVLEPKVLFGYCRPLF